MGKEKFVRNALLVFILLTLVACNSSGPGAQNQNIDIEAAQKAKIVEQFDTPKYLAEVLADFNQFDLQAFAKHLKSKEDNETLQKLKFRAGILYYLSALDSLDRLRGGQEQPLSPEQIEKQIFSFIEAKTEVSSLILSKYQYDHLPKDENMDPMDIMPEEQEYEEEEFDSKYNYNCYRFFNNFNSIIEDVQSSMIQLMYLNNNANYTGVDSFRGGLTELIQKDAFSDHFSHWFKTGAITDETRREQNILMHKARLDALDMLIRTYILYSVFHNEGGGGIGQQSCINNPEDKGVFQEKITDLGLKIDLFYNAYFGVQSIKSRGQTLVDVAEHARDKIYWENWKTVGVEAILMLPITLGVKTVSLMWRGGQRFLGVGKQAGKTTKEVSEEAIEATARKKVSTEFSSRWQKVKGQTEHVESLVDGAEFLVFAGIEAVKATGMGLYRFSRNYLEDAIKVFKGQEDKMRFRRFIGVTWPIGSAAFAFYMFAEEAARDEVHSDYQPMMDSYKAPEDYALIDEDLRLRDHGQYQPQLEPTEWVNFNVAVEQFLESHTQSPKVYLKLMKAKYDYLDQIDFQQIEFLYEIFPNIKEDIRRHGDIDRTINYYLQLEKELSEELGLESEAS